MHKSSFLDHASFCAILLLSFLGQAQASLSEKEYFDALKIAEKKVQRLQAVQLAAKALSSPTPYPVGESWLVAAWHEEPAISRPFAQEQNTPINGRAGLFKYTVVATSEAGETEIQIQQIPTEDLPLIDEKVQSITLRLDSSQEQSGKTLNGSAIAGSLLKRFPLDLPEVRTAEKLPARPIPPLPPRLAKLAAGTKISRDFSHANWFEQDDLFGRPIQVLWQEGEPWPLYIRTPSGVALLLGKGSI